MGRLGHTMQCDVSICQNNGLGYCATHKLYSGCKTRLLKCVEMRRSDPCDTNNGCGIYDMGNGVYNENVPEIRLPRLPTFPFEYEGTGMILIEVTKCAECPSLCRSGGSLLWCEAKNTNVINDQIIPDICPLKNKGSEELVLQKFREMCIESLDPETFEKSEEVEYWLRKTRKNLKEDEGITRAHHLRGENSRR